MNDYSAYNRREKYNANRFAKIKSYLLTVAKPKVEIYAQTRVPGLYYKVILFTEFGAIKCDTSWCALIRKDIARYIIRGERLEKISLNQLLTNWANNNLWDFRIFEKEMVKNHYTPAECNLRLVK